MSLPSATAALGIAVLASSGIVGFGLPEPAPNAPRAIIVPVAALQQPLILVPPSTSDVDTDRRMKPRQFAATSDEDTAPPRFGPTQSTTPKSAPTPLVTPPAMRSTQPAPMPAAQPAPMPAMQPVPTMPRPAAQQWPASTNQPAPMPQPGQMAKPPAMPQPATMSHPAAAPQAAPMPKKAMPANASRGDMPRQVYGFDGIVASERALLQKTASTARYEAHIASTATEGEADKLWADLRGKLDAKHGEAVAHFKLIDVPGHGRFVRVLVGDFNDAAATADFCRAVIAQGRECRILRQLENKS